MWLWAIHALIQSCPLSNPISQKLCKMPVETMHNNSSSFPALYLNMQLNNHMQIKWYYCCLSKHAWQTTFKITSWLDNLWIPSISWSCCQCVPIICRKSGFASFQVNGESAGSLHFSSWEQSFQWHTKELLLMYNRKEDFTKINFEIFVIMYEINQF